MKKIIASAVSALLLFGLTACGSSTQSPTEDSSQVEVNVSETSTSVAKETADTSQTEDSKTLIVYFSASGNTEKIAGAIAEETGGNLFELEPVNPYSSEDLDWTADGSRVNLEHDDESLRTVELVSASVQDWDAYDTVFIGYPIWWGIAAWPVNEFITSNDFSGKTVIPFCTSASSDIGESAVLLSEMAGTGNWKDGYRFSSGASDSDVMEWLSTLNY